MRRVVLLLTILLTAVGCAVRTPAYPTPLAVEPTNIGPKWPPRRSPMLPVLFHGEQPTIEIDRLGKYGEGELVALTPRHVDGDPLGQSLFFFRSESPLRPGLFMRPIRIANPSRGNGERLLMWECTDPTLSAVLLPPRETAKGTVVYLTGLAGATPFELATAEVLRDRGWTAIVLTPQLAFGYGVDLARGADATPPLDAASMIAASIDDMLAERAYATEAMLAYLGHERPELPQRPLVVIGSSAGAIAVPSTVARLGGADAAVLVAGGADVFRIVRGSAVGRDSFEVFRNDDPVPARELRSLIPSVLARSTLDPMWSSDVLLDTPVLMLHAMFDRVVPAASGQLLYERLGRPERWSYPLGHYGLFTLLPWQSEKIADWVEAAVERDGR